MTRSDEASHIGAARTPFEVITHGLSEPELKRLIAYMNSTNEPLKGPNVVHFVGYYKCERILEICKTKVDILVGKLDVDRSEITQLLYHIRNFVGLTAIFLGVIAWALLRR